MTYFFAGKVLEDMTVEELKRWEYYVRKECCCSSSSIASTSSSLLDQHWHTNTNKNNNHDSNNELVLGSGSVSRSDYSLRFKSLSTFPPNRQNLIVAMFEPSPALCELYDRLCRMAVKKKKKKKDHRDRVDNDNNDDDDEKEQAYEFPLLRELTLKQQRQREKYDSPKWIAHVTLGNLVGGSREDASRLNEWLVDNSRNYVGGGDDTVSDNSGDEEHFLSSTVEEVNDHASTESNDVLLTKMEQTSRLLGSKVDALGLALGGPVPEHVDIDWDFPFYNDVASHRT